MNFKEIWRVDVDGINLAQEWDHARILSVVMNLWAP
jgi:hypothetical protein